MRLSELVEAADVNGRTAWTDREIAGLTSDSREVRPGYLFAALPGQRHDGRDFISEAVARGAGAVLASMGTGIEHLARTVAFITDDNPRRRFAMLAARFHARQPPTVAAVTGTNGKTSVVTFVRQIWTRLGRRAASAGTLGVSVRGAGPERDTAQALTTPDAADLHACLRRLADDGVAYLALEASSHGLAQFRLDGVCVAAAAFTGLGRDHLDYHGTADAYLAAKLRLFSELLSEGGAAVVNVDGAGARAVCKAARARGADVLTVGAAGDHVRLESLVPEPGGQRARLRILGRPADVRIPLVGDVQAANALTALGLAIATGAAPEAAVPLLETLEGARGRLELAARHPSGALVYVDYAHTPDALAGVLGALRPHVRGHLVVVFGAGGDRDAGKRPKMGRMARERADVVFVTDDNPRGEDPAAIRRQILAGCPGATEVGDRAEAIRLALATLAAGDVLVVAGKGHEQGQIVGDRVRPFDDVEVVRRALAEAAP